MKTFNIYRVNNGRKNNEKVCHKIYKYYLYTNDYFITMKSPDSIKMPVDNANWLLTCFYLLLHYIDITQTYSDIR